MFGFWGFFGWVFWVGFYCQPCFEDAENIYIVLENCARKSLVHVLKARHVVTEPETRYYMSQLVHGVEYIHSQNIIHRYTYSQVLQ
jgi:serine/threonine protein kinase